jgi:hypothetical protein
MHQKNKINDDASLAKKTIARTDATETNKTSRERKDADQPSKQSGKQQQQDSRSRLGKAPQ